MAVKKIRINEAEETIDINTFNEQDVYKINEIMFDNLNTVEEYLDIYNKFANQLDDYSERFSNVSLNLNIISDFKQFNELITDHDLRVYGKLHIENPKVKQIHNMFEQKFLITEFIHDINVAEQFDFSLIVNTYKLINEFVSRLHGFLRILKSMYADTETIFVDFYSDALIDTDNLDRQELHTEYRVSHDFLYGVDNVDETISDCTSLSSEIDSALNQLGV